MVGKLIGMTLDPPRSPEKVAWPLLTSVPHGRHVLGKKTEEQVALGKASRAVACSFEDLHLCNRKEEWLGRHHRSCLPSSQHFAWNRIFRDATLYPTVVKSVQGAGL